MYRGWAMWLRWWKWNFDASKWTQRAMPLFVFICKYILFIIKYVIVWTFFRDVVQILGLAKCWVWREHSKEFTRMSRYLPFNILIDTLTFDTIYWSNLKNRFPIYIAYLYAALLLFVQILSHLRLLRLCLQKVSQILEAAIEDQCHLQQEYPHVFLSAFKQFVSEHFYLFQY